MLLTFMYMYSRLDVKECNFPDELSQVFRGQAIEICRKCVEPPMLLRPRLVFIHMYVCTKVHTCTCMYVCKRGRIDVYYIHVRTLLFWD